MDKTESKNYPYINKIHADFDGELYALCRKYYGDFFEYEWNQEEEGFKLTLNVWEQEIDDDYKPQLMDQNHPDWYKSLRGFEE